MRELSASLTRNGVPFTLFSNVCFSLEPSGIYDLVGASGAGKSTLLRICARMLERSAGKLFLDGVLCEEIPAQRWRKAVCLVPQKASLVPGTVAENLLLPWKLKIRAKETPPSETYLKETLEKAGLHDVELSRDVSQLSGGQAARVALLRAFVTQPRVLLLDEVDAALDDTSSRAISSLTAALIDENTACLRVRHRASDGLARGVLTLAEGTLRYEKTESALRAAPEVGTSAVSKETLEVKLQEASGEETPAHA